MAILITGGTKGIGRAIAEHFSRPGQQVFLNYVGDSASAEQARQVVQARGAECHLIRQDVGTPEGCQALLAEVAKHTGRLDQLVHCAVRVVVADLLDMDPHAFADALNVNGSALLYLTQAALPLLQRGSSIIFLSSRGGRIVLKNYAAIGAGKALAECLMRYLATELAPRGIRINTVAPSIIDTAAVRAVFGSEAGSLVAQAAATNPSGRGVHPEDCCKLIEYLASPAAEMIQGQVVFVNGGANLAA